MRSRYRIELKEPVSVEEQWPIPVLSDGQFKIRTEDGKITAFEVSFTAQPVEYGFRRAADYKQGRLSIDWHDPRRNEMLDFFRRFIAYLQCNYDIDMDVDEIQCWYEPETEQERQQLVNEIQGIGFGKTEKVSVIPHECIAAALFAAEAENAPFLAADLSMMARRAIKNERYIDSFRYSFLLIEFLFGDGQFKKEKLKQKFKANRKFRSPFLAADLSMMARRAIKNERYIDSFRYSFLLIEFLFGDGQFKKEKLKQKFKANRKFRSMVRMALDDPVLLGGPASIEVNSLLKRVTSVDEAIDFIVDRRGFYFHGNIKRPSTWKSHQQEDAKALGFLAMAITKQVSRDETNSIYSDVSWQRYRKSAESQAAILAAKIRFILYDPSDNCERSYNTETDIVGTRWMPKHAVHIAIDLLQQILCKFEKYDLRFASVLAND